LGGPRDPGVYRYSGVEKKSRGGGPKSTNGKQASSQNATKHGGRSKIMRILPDEDPEEYERVKNGWNAEYEPEGHMEETLANNLIESEWMLLRARRNRFNAEARAVGEGKEPHEWTAEDSPSSRADAALSHDGGTVLLSGFQCNARVTKGHHAQR
jgi:hypothetical protein